MSSPPLPKIQCHAIQNRRGTQFFLHMSNKDLRVHLVYRECSRCLHIPAGMRVQSIQSAVNGLFRDMDCHCIALRSPVDAEIVFLHFVEEDLSILEKMAKDTAEPIRVIGESGLRLFP